MHGRTDDPRQYANIFFTLFQADLVMVEMPRNNADVRARA